MADDLKFVISVDDRDLIRAQKEQRKFQANVITIEQAYRSGAITASRYNGELAKQASQLSKLGGTYNKANSEVRKYAYSIRNATNEQLALSAASVMGGKNVNRFGMYAQQVGYQVGDFFVQVQSGTSALVAFGQQGTQLAGLLPGLTGAVVGISLAVGTMLARSFLQARDAAEKASGEFISMKDALEGLDKALKSSADSLKYFQDNSELIIRQKLTTHIQTLNKALETYNKLSKGYAYGDGASEAAKTFTDQITSLQTQLALLTKQNLESGRRIRLLKGEDDAMSVIVEKNEVSLALEQIRADLKEGRMIRLLQGEDAAMSIVVAKNETSLALEQKRALLKEGPMLRFLSAEDLIMGQIVGKSQAILDAEEKRAKVLFDMATTRYKLQGLAEETVMSQSLTPVTLPKGKADPKGSKPSGTRLEVLEAESKARQAALILGDTELAMYERQLEIRQALGDYSKNYTDAQVEQAAKVFEARQAEEDQLNRLRQQQIDLANTIASSMGDAIMSMVDGTKSAEDAFKSMAAEIIKELYRVLVVQQMVNAAMGVFGYQQAPSGSYVPKPNANGNAFSGGNVIPFASGGVVGSPTNFAMSGGRTGLMGEAGPEAIMPLKRGADGKLGVATTGGSQSITVNQVINVSTGVQQTVRAEIMGMMPQIAAASKSAVLDAKRRGGSFGGSFR
jgi:hypothetical protein